MSYHTFPNLSQAFMGDLTVKITKDVKSRDFKYLVYNCNWALKVNRLCMFRDECRKNIIVYKTECKDCNMC